VNVKNRAALTGILFFGFLLIIGCQGLDNTLKLTSEEEGSKSKPKSVRPRKKREFQEIRREYDLETLLLPVLQFNNLVLSFDYYPQFAWDGDAIFPEYLLKVFGVEASPFRPGEGTVLEAGYEDTGMELRIERILLVLEDNGAWWQVTHIYLGDGIQYEVFVSKLGVPLLIRYTDPQSGAVQEAVPALREFNDDSPEADHQTLLEHKRLEQIEKEWSYAFNSPEIIGEELVDAGSGQFMTVHVRDRFDDEYGSGADYWISPDVPGNIVKIVYSGPGQTSYVVELRALTLGDAVNPLNTATGIY
jgi:hypothetical protein